MGGLRKVSHIINGPFYVVESLKFHSLLFFRQPYLSFTYLENQETNKKDKVFWTLESSLQKCLFLFGKMMKKLRKIIPKK